MAGNVLLRAEDRVVLFDVQQQVTLAELMAFGVNYAFRSNDMAYVALVSKQGWGGHVFPFLLSLIGVLILAITIANKRLEQMAFIQEPVRVKSGVWDEQNVFVYSTLTHIKYALPQGDSGIIRTIDQVVYPVHIKGQTLCCLDRDARVRIIAIDPTEYSFKLALLTKRYETVVAIANNSTLIGEAVIAYLQQKGYPEVSTVSKQSDMLAHLMAFS